MNQELIHFLEQVDHDQTMYFVLSNMNLNELLQFFELLDFTSKEVKERWEKNYMRLLGNVTS
jgi:hypothetical protein